MGNEVLDVDLTRLESGDVASRRALVDGVRRSLATGFVFARTGIPGEFIDEAYELLARFFHLPTETKENYIVAGSKGQSGYTGTLIETASGSDQPDWKEMLNWGAEVPADHPLKARFPSHYPSRRLPEEDVPGSDRILGRLHDLLLDLQRRLLRVVALGLGCAEGYFDEMTERGATLTRAIRYPPMAEAPSRDHVWADEHKDINLTTALPRATARGLQVRTEDGWIDVAPPDDHAILNTGLMLERLTNGRIPGGVHRVVADPASVGERYSVVQFCHPTPWTILAPIPTCVDEKHPPSAPPITAGDYLEQVLYEINMSGR